MPTPIVTGTAQVVSEVVEKPLPITREVIESYLACKTKAYLKLHGERGTRVGIRIAPRGEKRAEVSSCAIVPILSAHGQCMGQSPSRPPGDSRPPETGNRICPRRESRGPNPLDKVAMP